MAFDLIGAAAWAEQARAELRAAGDRTAAPAASAPAADALSAQELQIARLAADGLSNREIGERLYLSPAAARLPADRADAEALLQHQRP
jgi:DNA-binding NarL/FixJ family response regulator